MSMQKRGMLGPDTPDLEGVPMNQKQAANEEDRG